MGTHWKKLRNPDYLGSWDLEPGEERILIIKNVGQEEIFNTQKNKKEACVIAYFVGNVKPMVLNATNCKTIQNLYGMPDTEEWADKQIVVEVKKIKAFGKLEDALRIKNERPSKIKPKEPPKCRRCGKEILPTDKLSAKQVAAYGIEKFGAPTCIDCANEIKREE